MKHIVVGVFLYFASVAVWAESWNIAEQLVLSPPDGLNLTFESFDQLGNDSKHLASWHNDEVLFLVVVENLPIGVRAKKYWKSLEQELKKVGDRRRIKRVRSGRVITDEGKNVPYKIYRFNAQGEEITQIYYLVQHWFATYGLMVTVTQADGLALAEERSQQVVKALKFK